MILKKDLRCAVTPLITDQTTRRNIREDLNLQLVAYPGILFGEGGGSTNLVEDREQRERRSGGS